VLWGIPSQPTHLSACRLTAEKQKEKKRKEKERKGKERKGKERKGKERKGKERKGKKDYTFRRQMNEKSDCRADGWLVKTTAVYRQNRARNTALTWQLCCVQNT